jgi:hypothetical protein
VNITRFRGETMTLNHILALSVGAAIAITGALTGTAPLLLPLSTLLIGGVLGHVSQPNSNKSSKKGIQQ